MCPRSHSLVAKPRLALSPSLELVRGITLQIAPGGHPDPSQGPPCRPREQETLLHAQGGFRHPP